MEKSQATNIPVSDRVTRERTFEVISKRLDKKDAIAQMVITLNDVLTPAFVGQIVLNCNGGAVNSIQVREVKRIQKD